MHLQAYVVTALQMFSLDAVNATEFLEVYKGVVPPGEFSGMLDELTSGTNLVWLLIAQKAMRHADGSMPQSNPSNACCLEHSQEIPYLIFACKEVMQDGAAIPSSLGCGLAWH